MSTTPVSASEAPAPARNVAFVDRAKLEADLRKAIVGEVRFDSAARGLYSTDASNYRQVPIGVVIPRNVDDVVRAVAIARAHGAPVLSRGGGTSLAGQCCNAAIVLDHSKYFHHILELDPASRVARVEPGCVLDTLRNAAEAHHLTFGPDPATHSRNTLGGMVGNNSCGVHSVSAGKTVENVEALEILTYDGLRLRVGATGDDELASIIAAGGRRGEIYAAMRALRDRYADQIRARYPKIPRRVSGYNLNWLLPENGFHVARALVGSESTLVTVLEITARLVTSPPGRALVVLGYGDIAEAGDHVMEVLAHGPIALEGIDDLLVDDMKKQGIHPEDVELMPEGRGWLVAEFGGETDEQAAERARAAMEQLRQSKGVVSTKLVTDRTQQHQIWIVRESGLGGSARVPGQPDTYPGWEDSAVPPDKVGSYLRDMRRLMDAHGYTDCSLYGHLGDGCVHVSISFDFKTQAGIANYKSFLDEASDAVLKYGGSLSGEHGDGQARADLLPKMFGPEIIEAFREFKAIWDPEGKMNPGKIVDAYHVDQNLRIGPTYDPPLTPVHFDFGADASFAAATTRCFGVGACRNLEGGTMCPSYRVTRDEQHSTRGRARLLFEMLQGDPVKGGWRDEGVHEALDLCLACKGCKGDCPLHVDMASYKAEFLSHYYAGRLRPPSAYAMGLIYWWARAASHAPRLVNALGSAPVLGSLAKRVAGVAPQRRLPQFAERPFTRSFRPTPERGGKRVLLWPDTFNNYFHADTARSAVRVLESLGFAVEIPPRPLCCGRPLYDFGMLGLARRVLRQTLDTLKPWIEAGVPIVGLEPSCIAVFREELGMLFPHDEDAKRLAAQAVLLSELIDREVPDAPLPQLGRTATVHGHCHHKSVLGMEPERRVLDRLGLDYELLDSGCCGMAGSFGFERQHYDVSVAVGELVLLPAVRRAAADTLVIADGFSCREQISQSGGRTAVHLADVLAMGLDQVGK
ncbi:MAG: FAD-binding oxidoreductase [Chloroflexota bacterium]|nr:FAD-binding oxidoreductase [Chloroflexota bacterium]